MRTTLGQLFASRATVTQRSSSAEHGRAPTVRIATVWQDALAMFVLRAPAILLITSVCIAGPAVLGLLINTALGLERFVHSGGPFATWEAIVTLQRKGSIAVVVVGVVQVGLGAIGLAFARGVIARLALSDTQDTPSLSLACREAQTRFPSLLVGSLIYGACVTVGAVGINATLRDTAFDLSLVGQRTMTAPGQLRVVALRTLDAFVPNPGSPFVEFVPLLRHASFANTTHFAITARSSSDMRYWSYTHDQAQAQGSSENASPPAKWSDTPMLAIGLASLGMLLLAEALLRFAPTMAMSTCGRTGFGAITPVIRSTEFGIRHFGAITKHVWLLRLAFVAGYTIFFILPVVLSQDVAPHIVRNMTMSVMGSWSALLTLMCHSFVIALFVAFSTVYDVRLAMQLGLLDSHKPDPAVSARLIHGRACPKANAVGLKELGGS